SGNAGSFAGAAVVSVPGVSFTGTLTVSFDTGAGTIGVSGTGIALDVSGQRLAGDFAFAKNGAGVTVTATNATLSLGGGLVTLTSTGTSTLAIDALGLAGTFT